MEKKDSSRKIHTKPRRRRSSAKAQASTKRPTRSNRASAQGNHHRRPPQSRVEKPNSERSEIHAAPRQSGIEWTGTMWNTVAGCTAVSPACAFCYAGKRMAPRLQGRAEIVGDPTSPNLGIYDPEKKHFSGKVNLIPGSLEIPYMWSPNRPTAVFVNGQSDTFHEDVPDHWIEQMFNVMRMPNLKNHWFQLLTKRADRLRAMGPSLPWAPNIWPGVTVESEKYLDRVDDLINCGAPKVWLSIEPLLGSMKELKLDKRISWVIVGGESGNNANPDRRTREEWVIDLRDRCADAGIPFFFKQWGCNDYNPLFEQGKVDMTAVGKNKAKGGCLLQGKICRQVPAEFEHFFTDLITE